MLKIRDKNNKTKFVWRDEDDEPISLDKVVIEQATEPDKASIDEQEKKNATDART